MWWCEVDQHDRHFNHCCTRLDNMELKWHKRYGHDACGPKNPRNQTIPITGALELHQYHLANIKKVRSPFVRLNPH